MTVPRIHCTAIEWYSPDGRSRDLPYECYIDEDSSLVQDTIDILYNEKGILGDAPDFNDRFVEQLENDEEGCAVITDYLNDMYGQPCNAKVKGFRWKVVFV